MRRFVLDSGSNRKAVTLEVRETVLRVTRSEPDGSTLRSEKTFPGAADARRAAERMAAELTARGFREQARTDAPTAPRRPAAVAPGRSAVLAAEPSGGPSAYADLDDVDLSEGSAGDEEAAEPLLPRQRAATAPGDKPKKAKAKAKKKGGKKRSKSRGDSPGTGGDLDKRVIAALGALALLVVAGAGYFAYDAFLKPPSIVGHWEGSRTEHEIGKKLTNTSYRLILGADKRASMTLQEKLTSTGTYAVQGDRLRLSTKDEDGEAVEVEYKFALRRGTLDLFEPDSGQKVVQLIRFHESMAAKATAPAPAAPKGLAEPPAIPAVDDNLASVEFASKDGAFRIKRPVSWKVESGSRVDNTYSWARFTGGSGKVQVFADVAGSLMTGSSQNQHGEGSELAPVHAAHELYARSAAENYSDYKESPPTLFKTASGGLGEGRISSFTAGGGGLFGSKLRGYRVTFLTNDRRISILAEAPEGQFEATQATLLAIARSAAR